MTVRKGIRVIAHYLPQFHPIPENDEWWGKGFTEWTNVARAKPLFPGHHQPNLPGDLGFYDLRVPETRAAQAEMARAYGIEGFCYWHYWFGNGKRLLERPFAEVVASGEPRLPFCLAWANHSWIGASVGAAGRTLIEQAYPGLQDYIDHFEAILPALIDERHILVHGKPIFLVFGPEDIPDSRLFTDTWRDLAHKAGLRGLYLVGVTRSNWTTWDPRDHGYDASALHNSLKPAFLSAKSTLFPGARLSRMEKAVHSLVPDQLLPPTWRGPARMEYADALRYTITDLSSDYLQIPTLLPNWDNTPRAGRAGFVLMDPSPDNFRKHVQQIFRQVEHRPEEERIVLVKSWNEWAEGNYLEPDLRFGTGYLDVLKAEMRSFSE